MKRLWKRLRGHLVLGISVGRNRFCFYGHKHQHFLGSLEVSRNFFRGLLMAVYGAF